MQLSRNFSLQELTKSDTAIRKGIDNEPNADQIDKNGRLLYGDDGKPLKEKGFIQKNIEKIPGAIKDLTLPGSSGFTSKPQTPPLGDTPMPVQMASNTQQKNPQTNLTRNEEALLSPTEKVIASRT